MLRTLRKALFYLIATSLVLVALVVGAMRLAMPQLPEYRDEIQARIAEALDTEVTFERIDARWRWRGPEILLDNLVVGPRIAEQEIEPVQIRSVAVGVSFLALALRREVVIRHISLEGVVIALQRDSDGWSVQDFMLSSGQVDAPNVPVETAALPIGEDVDIRISDVSVIYSDRLTDRAPMVIDLVKSRFKLEGLELSVDASLRRRDGSQSRVDFFATGALRALDLQGMLGGTWRAHADLSAISAELAEAFLPPTWRLPINGSANVAADVSWDAAQLRDASLSLDAAALQPPDGGDRASVSGRAELTRTASGWLCAVDDFVVGVADREWPAASMRLSLDETDTTSLVRFDVANMTVYDLPYLASFLPEQAANTVLGSRLSGTIVKGDGFLQFDRDVAGVSGAPGALDDYEVNLEYVGLSVASLYGLPGFSNLTGTLRMTDETGSLTLNSEDAALVLPSLFAEDVAIDEIAGTLIWRQPGDVVNVVSDAIRVRSRSLEATGTLEMVIQPESGVESADIAGSWSLGDVNDAKALLPTAILRPKLTRWLQESLRAGRITRGDFALQGNLADFPFRDGNGVFRASASASDVVMRYASQWPTLTDVSADVVLDGLTLSTRTNRGLSGDIPFQNSFVRFNDITSGELLIDTEGSARLSQLRAFAADSPIAKVLGGQLERMSLEGNAAYEVQLRVPLKQVRDFEFSAEFETNDGSFALDYLPFNLTEIDGLVRFDRGGAYATGVTGRLLGGDTTIAVSPTSDLTSLLIEADGMLSASDAVETFEIPIEGRANGVTPYQARLKLPRRKPDAPLDATRSPITVSLTSDLQGVEIDLPYPVGKSAEASADLRMSLAIGDVIDGRVRLAPLVDVVAEFARTDGEPLQFDRATVHLGEGEALRSSAPGLFIDGVIDRLRLGDWLALRQEGSSGFMDLLQSIAVEVDDLYVFGQRVLAVSGTLQRSGDDWLIDVQGPSVAGTIALPRSLTGSAPVVLDMQRLALIEADPLASGNTDPTKLPALRIRAESFALGEREFGVLEAELNRVSDGLQANRIATASDAFSLSATGSWLASDDVAAGSITRLQGTVQSTDVERMMAQLGYAPGVAAIGLNADFEVSWDGGPSTEFLSSLDGEAQLKIDEGTLDEVDPGAGRVVGLLSLVELPRRLSLDFSDVFRKGFKFEEITGDFRIVNGDAFTCNLALKSPAADVGLIGRASLDRRNYNQTAIVSVKVGNTLPAVGAVVAGPQVGAALLLFSQIFKKPLQGMTEVYYQINGSWDEPSIDRTDAERFVATSDLAGCLLDVPN
ncbi:MAG: YhdP family protein [Pseudomonadota bacterium]